MSLSVLRYFMTTKTVKINTKMHDRYQIITIKTIKYNITKICIIYLLFIQNILYILNRI